MLFLYNSSQRDPESKPRGAVEKEDTLHLATNGLVLFFLLCLPVSLDCDLLTVILSLYNSFLASFVCVCVCSLTKQSV